MKLINIEKLFIFLQLPAKRQRCRHSVLLIVLLSHNSFQFCESEIVWQKCPRHVCMETCVSHFTAGMVCGLKTMMMIMMMMMIITMMMMIMMMINKWFWLNKLNLVCFHETSTNFIANYNIYFAWNLKLFRIIHECWIMSK